VEVDCYQILGVKPDADKDTLKRAYRKKALSSHPDRVGGSHRAFALVYQAYAQALERLSAPSPSESTQEQKDEGVFLGMAFEVLSLKLDGLPVPESFIEGAWLLNEEDGVMIKVGLEKAWTRGAGEIDVVLEVKEGTESHSVAYTRPIHSRAYRGYGMVAMWFSPA
jgi:hypothetical protein